MRPTARELVRRVPAGPSLCPPDWRAATLRERSERLHARLLRIWEGPYRACTHPPLNGDRKRSSAIIRSVALPAKRSRSMAGSASSLTGGMKAARALLQNGVVVNAFRHQPRQRTIV